MRFRTRGRPKTSSTRRDFGTAELQQKRAEHLTEELLDGYRRAGLIDEQQYWCANHFRWLYSVRYGVPSLQSLQRFSACNPALPQLSEAEQQRLCAQYLAVCELLAAHNLLPVVLKYAVFHVYIEATRVDEAEKAAFIRGLDILVDLWQ